MKIKPNKLQEIKETASDAAEIMRQIGNPAVMESLNKVKDTTKVVNEIIQGLNTSNMVKNIENFRLITENMNEVSTKMENTVNQLRETGLIDDTSKLIQSAHSKISSFDENNAFNMNGQDLREISIASREMILSIKDLVNEITLNVSSSKASTTICNVKNTIKELSHVNKMPAA